ncbi:MAG: hypothetical protein U0640_15525 [Phycisphaerales bacterium]
MTIARAQLQAEELLSGAASSAAISIGAMADAISLCSITNERGVGEVLRLVRNGKLTEAEKAIADISTALSKQTELLFKRAEEFKSSLPTGPEIASPLENLVTSAQNEAKKRLDRFEKILNGKVDGCEELIDQLMLRSLPLMTPFDQARGWLQHIETLLNNLYATMVKPLQECEELLNAVNRMCKGICETGKSTAKELIGRIDQVMSRLNETVESRIRSFDQIQERLLEHITTLRRSVRAFSIGGGDDFLAGIQEAMKDVAKLLVQKVKGFLKDTNQKWDKAKQVLDVPQTICDKVCELVKTDVTSPILEGLSTIRKQIGRALLLVSGPIAEVDKALSDIRKLVVDAIDKVRAILHDAAVFAKSKIVLAMASSQTVIEYLLNPLVEKLSKPINELEELKTSGLNPPIVELRKRVETFAEELKRVVYQELRKIVIDPEKAREVLNRIIGEKALADEAKKKLPQIESALTRIVNAKTVGDHATKLKEMIEVGDVQEQIKGWKKEIENIRKATSTVQDAAAKIEHAAKGIVINLKSESEKYTSVVTRAARAVAKRDVFAIANSGLELHRAFGEPPRVPGLEFNRKQISYHFSRIKNAIDTTPMGALLDRAGDQLKGLGLRLPTDSFEESFKSALREKLDIGQLFPDFAGLKLSDLFPNTNLGSLNNDHVRVKHEFDAKSRTAAVLATIDYPLASEATLVDAGILTIVLRDGRLRAKSRLETSNGAVKREVQGSISAHWEIRFNGSSFATFMDTSLDFDASGKFKFNLQPEKMKLNGVLGFIAEKLRSLMPDDGDTVRYIRDALGLPRGVEVNIFIPVPDSQGGTSGFSGLSLGANFMIALGEITNIADPAQIKEAVKNFEVGVGFSLAKRNKPFMVTAFILGGCGHLELGLSYRPMRKQLRAFVDVSISASASLAFSVAGVSGGVYASLGIVFRYEIATGMQPNLVFSARLMIWGEVDVWGIVSASISIELRLAYVSSRKQLVAAGRLRIRIKICWCFTIKVSVGFTIPAGVSESEMGMQSMLPEGALRGLAIARLRDSIDHAVALSV